MPIIKILNLLKMSPMAKAGNREESVWMKTEREN